MTPLKKDHIYVDGQAAPRGAYSPAVSVSLPGGGRMLFVTGQIGRALDGSVYAPNDVTAQTEFIFTLIEEILTAAGMGLGDIVRLQTYLTHMPDYEKYTVVRDRLLGEFKPASTLLEVKGLAHVGCVIEIEVTAISAE